MEQQDFHYTVTHSRSLFQDALLQYLLEEGHPL
jgi:hypothetical protein